MYLLCDCDNFYASCERVFRPDLKDKPIVVLSNNDGCVIARSNEAKHMGYKMGAPFYQVKDSLEKDGVAVFSSNYTLYGDMSRRVMMLLSSYSPISWQYSIDEMFLDLSGLDYIGELRQFGLSIRHTITKGTGIPVTIGIASTKTLAKMASKYGKKYQAYEHVCIIDTPEKQEKALRLFDIADVWGIGRRHVERLRSIGVETAWDLTQKSESWVRKHLTVTGVRTWKELQGIDCIDIDELPQKKSICTSRSFADDGLSDINDLDEALADFTSSCAIKLQNQHSVCQSLTIFAHTSMFNESAPYKYINTTVQLPVPTNDQRELIQYALGALHREWDGTGGYKFKKAGTIVWNISRDDAIQTSLFDTIDRIKQKRIVETISCINAKNGAGTIKIAAQGLGKKWHLKCELKSLQYTTNIDEIIEVH